MSLDFSYDEMESLQKARQPQKFEKLLFPAGETVTVKVVGTKGVQKTENNNEYCYLKLLIKSDHPLHGGKDLHYTVWETDPKWTSPEKPCRLKVLLSNYFNGGELKEGMFRDEKIFADRVVGSVLEMIPTKITKNQKTLEDQQNFYGFKVISTVPGLQVETQVAGVIPPVVVDNGEEVRW